MALTFPYDLKITIPDQATLDRLVNAFGDEFIGTLDVDGNPIPDPTGKLLFAKQRLIKYVMNFVKNKERQNTAISDLSLT